jgi:hypothetical protein
MIVGGRNVHPEEVNRFSRSREADARIGEHHDAECNQRDCYDGFCVHIESMVDFLADSFSKWFPAGDDPEQNHYDGYDEQDMD